MPMRAAMGRTSPPERQTQTSATPRRPNTPPDAPREIVPAGRKK